MKHYINILLGCFVSVLIGACTEETALAPGFTAGTINFTLSESDVVTRASGSDEDFVSTLELFFFDSTSKECVNVQKKNINGTPGSVAFEIPKSGKYDVYAIASYETGLTAGTATIEKLKALYDTRFVPDFKKGSTSDADFLPKTTSLKYLRSEGATTVDRPIPMSGALAGYTSVVTNPTIQLKRNVAKVRIQIVATSSFTGGVGTILTDKISVAFRKVKTAAYLFPGDNDISSFSTLDYPWVGYKNEGDLLSKDPTTSDSHNVYAYLQPSDAEFGFYLCVPYTDLSGVTHMENYYWVAPSLVPKGANNIYDMLVSIDGTGSLTDAITPHLKSSCTILPWEETTISGDIGGTYLKVEKTSLTMTDDKSAVLNFETDASKVEIDWGGASSTDNLDRSVKSVTPVSGKGSITFKWDSKGTPLQSLTKKKVTLIAGNIKKEVEVNYTFDVPSFSNCYIVKPGASVSIPIRGPWAHWLKNLGTTLPTSATLTTKVLWTSICGNNVPASDTDIVKSVTVVSGTSAQYNKSIRVTAGSVKGNGTVGLYVNGTLRWSWHIWVTDYTPNYGTVQFQVGSQILWMNRNLGAMTDDPTNTEYGLTGTYGLYYQWGRKDPFIGPASFDSSGRGNYRYHNLGIVDNRSTTADKKTMIMNPGTYYGENTWSADDWGGVTQKKSPYDPCPEGWRVPADNASGVSPWKDLLYPGLYENLRFEWNFTVPETGKTYSNGCTLYDLWNFDNSLRVCCFYPASGYYRGEGYFQFFYAGEGGDYWQGALSKSQENAVYGFSLTPRDPKYQENYSIKGNAMPVRCCRER